MPQTLITTAHWPGDSLSSLSPDMPVWHGAATPDGDATPYKDVPVGSVYVQRTTNYPCRVFVKVKDDNADNDWAEGLGVLRETFALADFTDGGGAAGTVTFAGDIPAGALVVQSTLTDITGFAGDTSAVITIGDGSDVDRYNTGTPSVFTTAAMVAAGAVSGTAIHTTAVSPVVTVTSATDFGAVTAGSVTVTIYYYR